MTTHRSTIEHLLNERATSPGAVVSSLPKQDLLWLDFSDQNTALRGVDLTNTAQFSEWLFGEVLRGKIGIGGFMEHRAVYHRSGHFGGDDPRTVHLGIDIWTKAGTPVRAPWPGVIHSFRDNEGFGNYGPTVILEHRIATYTFYTLYGHLSRASIRTLRVEQKVDKNQRLGKIGPYPENGDWPPHLHFQAMTDLLGWVGDFPGVVAPSQQKKYEKICIDPRYLLRTT